MKQVTLYHISGQAVYETFPETDNLSVDLQRFAPGTYLLRVVTSNEETVRKIVKGTVAE